MNKRCSTLAIALLGVSSAGLADINIGVIDPGLIIDPGDLIGPILAADPCSGATYRFTVDGGTVTKYDELSEAGVYRATATATLSNNDPAGVDGYLRQGEVAPLTGGEISWTSQDMFVFPGWGWATGQSFARDTLAPQTGDNAYWGITRDIMLESTQEPWDFTFRYIFDNFGGNVEVCFFELD